MIPGHTNSQRAHQNSIVRVIIATGAYTQQLVDAVERIQWWRVTGTLSIDVMHVSSHSRNVVCLGSADLHCFLGRYAGATSGGRPQQPRYALALLKSSLIPRPQNWSPTAVATQDRGPESPQPANLF